MVLSTLPTNSRAVWAAVALLYAAVLSHAAGDCSDTVHVQSGRYFTLNLKPNQQVKHCNLCNNQQILNHAELWFTFKPVAIDSLFNNNKTSSLLCGVTTARYVELRLLCGVTLR